MKRFLKRIFSSGIPFYIFTYEQRFKEIEKNADRLAEIIAEIYTITGVEALFYMRNIWGKDKKNADNCWLASVIFSILIGGSRPAADSSFG